MNVLIKNLGPIKNNTQKIDLTKNFYVFVGENNSGKTYVSQLLWTIFNEKIIQRFSEQVEISIDFENITSIDIDKLLVDDILAKYAIFIKKELANTYNIQNTPFEKTVLGDFSMVFDYDFERIKSAKFSVASYANFDKGLATNFFILDKKENELVGTFERMKYFNPDELTNHRIKSYSNIVPLKKGLFVDTIIKLLLNHNHITFFLPASRTFYSTFYQYIYGLEREKNEKRMGKVDELLKTTKFSDNEDYFREKLTEIHNSTKNPYSEPVNKLFEQLYNFNKDIEINENYTSLVEKVATLMGGSVVMNSIEGISMIDFFFKMNQIDKQLPMYMSSSSVNQLTLLYIYFKYWTSKNGNFLMIDEPEENLHPKNQIKLLDILIEFASQNSNKVLITTHSPLLAEAVNNYLYLDVLKNKFGIDPKKIIEENQLEHLNPEVSLSKDNLGVYFFDGKQIIDYGDDNYGVFFRDFKNVSNAVAKAGELLTDYIYLKERE